MFLKIPTAIFACFSESNVLDHVTHSSHTKELLSMFFFFFFFFFREAKGKSVNVASRAETHANRLSLTTSASEGMLSPHPGACRPS